MSTLATTIHIFLEIDNGTTKMLEFNTDEVTGRQIKEKGGVPLDSDLAKREGNRLVLVTNDETIEIKNGERFVDIPVGTIS